MSPHGNFSGENFISVFGKDNLPSEETGHGINLKVKFKCKEKRYVETFTQKIMKRKPSQLKSREIRRRYAWLSETVRLPVNSEERSSFVHCCRKCDSSVPSGNSS